MINDFLEINYGDSIGEIMAEYAFGRSIQPAEALGFLYIVAAGPLVGQKERKYFEDFKAIQDLLIQVERDSSSTDHIPYGDTALLQTGAVPQEVLQSGDVMLFGKNVKIRGHFALHSAKVIFNEKLGLMGIQSIRQGERKMQEYASSPSWEKNLIRFLDGGIILGDWNIVQESLTRGVQYEHQLKAMGNDVDVIVSENAFNILKRKAEADPDHYKVRKTRNGKDIIYYAPSGITHPDDAIITDGSIYVEFICDKDSPLKNYGSLGQTKVGLKQVNKGERVYYEPFYFDVPQIRDSKFINSVEYSPLQSTNTVLDRWFILRAVSKDIAYSTVFSATVDTSKVSGERLRSFELGSNIAEFIDMSDTDPNKFVAALTIGKALKELSLAFYINPLEAIDNCIKLGLFDKEIVSDISDTLNARNIEFGPNTISFVNFLNSYLQAYQRQNHLLGIDDLSKSFFINANTHCFNILNYMLVDFFKPEEVNDLLQEIKTKQTSLGIDFTKTAFGN